MSATRVTRLTKDVMALAPWSVPGAILTCWMAWPALTPTFKQETLGLAPATLPVAPAAAASKKDVFRSSGKYKFVKNEIGEAPTLVEE
ncbi:hypothetical protein CCR75_002883 [Bremia lactucae]|uniref:Uncharacterized protein n=1 Tax=Bremia lactucae TaxID=4779 RepID=A0A976FNC0_BRELC|nr:hypothetical protein CCR75_002883 [Bremia lactucae]